ncbi:PREDICTED: uncharacterized protein LOC103595771 [Galeopterus variegatus]|uniref:Uncharacterized protein LOC103595771 n=1 Tax=Galeopterus variegatus TaxID=482537 RepID=A0ABM0RA24_GALVR|nr:PREDICTED: uncharacterized protein LOC103595771 [Galeopterus variegatus]
MLRALCACVWKGSRIVLTSACSVALTAHLCGVYVLLQAIAWSAQLAGSWVALHVQLYCALLQTLRCIPLILLCEQAARWLVRASVWAGRGLARVWGVAAFVQLCAHMAFLGMCLCMHMCFAAISSKVRVRVHVPFRVQEPLSRGVKVRLQGWRHGRASGEAGAPRGEIGEEQKPQPTRSRKPTRRREVSRSRSELSPGGK